MQRHVFEGCKVYPQSHGKNHCRARQLRQRESVKTRGDSLNQTRMATGSETSATVALARVLETLGASAPIRVPTIMQSATQTLRYLPNSPSALESDAGVGDPATRGDSAGEDLSTTASPFPLLVSCNTSLRGNTHWTMITRHRGLHLRSSSLSK